LRPKLSNPEVSGEEHT